ncbi:protein SRC2-like [Carya illinoinensis]|uniref:protein SRC2-like n=1 Tax=Carya illinoinensis TaxID=32201 RepID=UPI001C71F65E|nr:protein SRC2-like [Carya illinoinensis]
MECTPLDIVIKFAKDLKDVNLFSKMDVYALVNINGNHVTKHATYSVRTLSGKTKGTLDISYKFNEKFTAPEIKQAESVMAYPVGYAAGSSGAAAYSPPGAYPQPTYAHPQVAPGYAGYPPGGYPQYPQYPPPGGYPLQPAYGYGGYAALVQQPHKPKKNWVGGGGGEGWLGDMISDVASYDAGFDDGFDF